MTPLWLAGTVHRLEVLTGLSLRRGGQYANRIFQFPKVHVLIERTQGAEARALIDLKDLQRPVREELDRVQEELAQFFVCDVELINRISTHMLRAHGKRFRPTLVLLSAQLKGELDPRGVLCAAIVELIHTATLIHDDSIDRSFTRRGLPTVNSLWNNQTSVLMGDYLYSKAFFLLVDNDLFDVLHLLAGTTHRMCLGEMFELEQQHNFDITEDQYNRLILDKTAILISAACEVGGYLAWGKSRDTRLLADFGTSLGMAFQIMDDILDIEGDDATLGKSTSSDIRDGKITLPLIQSFKNAPQTVSERIKSAVRVAEEDPSVIADIRAFAQEYGGLTYARLRARGYADRALELLDAFEPSPVRQTLHDAVEYVLQRTH